jgi:hypothetical protein
VVSALAASGCWKPVVEHSSELGVHRCSTWNPDPICSSEGRPINYLEFARNLRFARPISVSTSTSSYFYCCVKDGQPQPCTLAP